MEALAVGVLILAPLGYTEAISLRIDKVLEAPVGRPTRLETHTHPDHLPPAKPQTQFKDGVLIFTGIPTVTRPLDDPIADAGPSDPGPYVPYGLGQPGKGSAIDQLFASNHKPDVVGPSAETHRRVPVSHLDPGILIKQVQPIYPRPAQAARIEGTVLLAAVIDTDGRITQLRALSGSPFLVPAAIEAVRQWRYKPYLLNGVATEVETQVSVIFTLQR